MLTKHEMNVIISPKTERMILLYEKFLIHCPPAARTKPQKNKI